MSRKGDDPKTCPDCGRVHLKDKQLEEQINLADDFVKFMLLPVIDGYEERMSLEIGLLDSVIMFEVAKRLIRDGQTVETLINNLYGAAEQVATDMDDETFHAAPERSQ